MNSAPVSVVIPTFNRGDLVAQAVESVLAQTAAPSEVIVVDDGSADDTRQRLAAFGSRLRYVYQENQGVSAARNHGLGVAECDLVAFLDADDVWHPRKLELQLAVFRQHPGLGLLGTCTFDWPAPALPELDAATAAPCVPVSWPQLVVKNYFATSSVLAWRGLLKQVGLFDPELHGPEDHDLWLRVAEAAPVANLALPLTGYRDQDGSLSHRPATMQTGMHRTLQKLDARRAWQGRWLLRRKAYSYRRYACAYLQRATGHPGPALLSLLQSLAWYPLPYRRHEVRTTLARPKALALILRQLVATGRDGTS